MKSKYLIAIVLAISLLISIPIISSASGQQFFVSGYYQAKFNPNFDDVDLSEDYFIECSFTLPYIYGNSGFGDKIYNSIVIMGSMETISYLDESNVSTTVYRDGDWVDIAYRIVDFGDGLYLDDFDFLALSLVYNYIPPTLENCTCDISLYTADIARYPFKNTTLALNGEAFFNNVTTHKMYAFGALFVRDGSFELWPAFSIQEIVTAPFLASMTFYFGDEIYGTLEDSPDRFSAYDFFVINGTIDSRIDNPHPPAPDVPSVPDGYFDNFFMNLLQAPFEALDSLIIYTTSSGFEISLFGVCSAVMGFSILIWLLKIVAGG